MSNPIVRVKISIHPRGVIQELHSPWGPPLCTFLHRHLLPQKYLSGRRFLTPQRGRIPHPRNLSIKLLQAVPRPRVYTISQLVSETIPGLPPKRHRARMLPPSRCPSQALIIHTHPYAFYENHGFCRPAPNRTYPFNQHTLVLRVSPFSV